MTNKINKILSNPNTPTENKVSVLDTFYRQEHKNDFYIAQKAVYDGIYPATREMTIEEKLINDTVEEEEVIIRDVEYVYPKVAIEYIATVDDVEVRTPLEYVTYVEYRDETVVVTESVDSTLDEEGFVLVEAVLEVSEEVRPYVAIEDVSLQVTEYLSTMAITFREIEYGKLNQDEMRFDDTVNGTTLWVDTIKAIKIKYPKV